MKKRYIKPQIAVENFYLAEMISGCEYEVTLTTTANCANNYDYDSSIDDAVNIMGVFTAPPNCTIIATEGTQIGSSCYHTSVGISVFGS